MKDYLYIMLGYFISIIIFLSAAFSISSYNEKQKYIENLEEKLNIYRESYEEFCLEDSRNQSDAYESI